MEMAVQGAVTMPSDFPFRSFGEVMTQKERVKERDGLFTLATGEAVVPSPQTFSCLSGKVFKKLLSTLTMKV